jgi:hypothetical protein
MKYQLPHFEEIDLTQVNEYYEAKIELNGQEIRIDLNFEKHQLEAKSFDIIKGFLEKIELQNTKNRTFIDADFKDENGDTIREYLEFHTEELKEELSEIINFDDQGNSPEQQLMEKLKLVRMGFYPDGKYGSESFVIFDYTVDRTITDQLIVVNIGKEGELLNLAWES